MAKHFNIDALSIRDGRCFGWGWYIDELSALDACELRIAFGDGETRAVAGIINGFRADLQRAFPAVPHAPSSGFLFHGLLPAVPLDGVTAVLVVRLVDGRTDEVLLTIPFQDGDDGAGEVGAGLLATYWAAWQRRRAEIGVAEASRRAISKLISGLGSRSTRIDREVHALRNRRVALLIDHDMGGGANVYRAERLRALHADGWSTILLTPRMMPLEYRVRFERPGKPVRHAAIRDPHQLLSLIADHLGLRIEVNNLVSFPMPLDIIRWCTEVKRASAGELRFHLHDFHSVCPSWTLVDFKGVHCGIPDAKVCAQCLPRNAANSLGLVNGVDIDSWRNQWRVFLKACDRITAFSDDSLCLLRKAYPQLDPGACVVEPHVVDTQGLRKVEPTGHLPYVIVVAGNISKPKGADMLRAIAARIHADALPIRIVVLGSLQGHRSDNGILVHGEYERRQLPSLLEQYDASMCFLPSICPETFSYVTAEFMAMGMPVAVFPIGAPAERVAGYAHGLILSRIDADVAASEMLDFLRKRFPQEVVADREMERESGVWHG